MCPGEGWASIVSAAAAVGLPRRASTTLTWLPFGAAPPHPSPMRPSSASRSIVASASQVEDDAERGPVPHQLERLGDAFERQTVRDEPVEREPARCGRARASRGSRARASTSRRSSRARAAPCGASSAPGSGTTASSRGMPISTAAPRRSGREHRREHRLGPPGRLDRVVDAAAARLADRLGRLLGASLPDDAVRRAEARAPSRASPATASTAITGSAPDRDGAPSPPRARHRRSRSRRPGRRDARRRCARRRRVPVVTAQPTSPAISNGTSRGIGTQHRSGTTHASANVERNE